MLCLEYNCIFSANIQANRSKCMTLFATVITSAVLTLIVTADTLSSGSP